MPLPPSERVNPADHSRFEIPVEAIRERAEASHAPGGAVAVVFGTAEPRYFTWGSRNREKRLDVTPETAFGVASVAKLVTSLAVLSLEAEGRLSVDQPASQLIPEITPLSLPHDPIRLSHLLNHTSGLPSLAILRNAIEAHNPRSRPREGPTGGPIPSNHPPRLPQTYSELAESVTDTARNEMLAPPGRVFSYSNEGYALLGLAVERAVGEPFEEYVRRTIFDTLGMSRTSFDVKSPVLSGNIATPYVVQPQSRTGRVVPGISYWDVPCLRPAGFLWSTLPDLVRLAQSAFVLGTQGPGRTLLSAAGRKLLLSSTVEVEPGVGYASGVYLQKSFRGSPLVWVGGNAMGISATLAYLPQSGVIAAALSNLAGPVTGPIVIGVFNELLGARFSAPRFEYSTAPGSNPDLMEFEGSYSSLDGTQLDVLGRTGQLMVFIRGVPMPGRPVAHGIFVVGPPDDEAILQFLSLEPGDRPALSYGGRIFLRSSTSRSLARTRPAPPPGRLTDPRSKDSGDAGISAGTQGGRLVRIVRVCGVSHPIDPPTPIGGTSEANSTRPVTIVGKR